MSFLNCRIYPLTMTKCWLVIYLYVKCNIPDWIALVTGNIQYL